MRLCAYVGAMHAVDRQQWQRHTQGSHAWPASPVGPASHAIHAEVALAPMNALMQSNPLTFDILYSKTSKKKIIVYLNIGLDFDWLNTTHEL